MAMVTAPGKVEFREKVLDQLGDNDILIRVKAAAICGRTKLNNQTHKATIAPINNPATGKNLTLRGRERSHPVQLSGTGNMLKKRNAANNDFIPAICVNILQKYTTTEPGYQWTFVFQRMGICIVHTEFAIIILSVSRIVITCNHKFTRCVIIGIKRHASTIAVSI